MWQTGRLRQMERHLYLNVLIQHHFLQLRFQQEQLEFRCLKQHLQVQQPSTDISTRETWQIGTLPANGLFVICGIMGTGT